MHGIRICKKWLSCCDLVAGSTILAKGSRGWAHKCLVFPWSLTISLSVLSVNRKDNSDHEGTYNYDAFFNRHTSREEEAQFTVFTEICLNVCMWVIFPTYIHVEIQWQTFRWVLLGFPPYAPPVDVGKERNCHMSPQKFKYWERRREKKKKLTTCKYCEMTLKIQLTLKIAVSSVYCLNSLFLHFGIKKQ